ncbi:hypothetical protein N7532_000664 [Penicillium argentinense]|uniref:Mob1 family protein n=1 Tax=Penicillium argentinense TaxID=1131581 RepID=A0A9W9KMT9_9EURO|nr:uncharacterized protein N7532_000664 [Penicillium argentinense]KAJ5112619.1 hypothetical protein N7532_000664 [Penicillium argentinense]
MTSAGASPSSSPRLPSPPPFTEVQIAPQSPSFGETFGKDAEQLLGGSASDDGSTRRIRPGTKAADMASGPPLVPLSQVGSYSADPSAASYPNFFKLDSPFQLQEHLKALYHHFTKPEGSDTVVPINRQTAIQLAQPPDGVDRSLWLYELCRFLTMKVNNLIIAFFAEDPPCSSQTCPEMRASEWQYLCAVHDPPKSCCAIDYCCHTLDWAMNTLTSPKYFPSRLTLGSETAGGPQASMRNLTNIFRRLYRIFAHAWFQHRNVFWEVEGNDGLYIFFKTVCDMFSLIPEDNYTIPAEAEGIDATESQTAEPIEGKRLTILRKEDENPFGSIEGLDPSISTGATTRRHKHSPSTGSHVGTITEAAEDSEESPQASAPLREVLKDSPEPPVEPRPQSPANTEITQIGPEETTEVPSGGTEQSPAQTEPNSNEAPVETAEQAERPAEIRVKPVTETPAQSEQSEELESNDAKVSESTENAPEGDDLTTSSADQETKEEPVQEPESKTES